MTSEQIILALLGTGGLASILGAIITGYLSRKRLSADAAHLITQAAGGVVERIEVELARTIKARQASEEREEKLDTRVQELEDRVARQKQEFEAEIASKEIVWRRVENDWRQALQLHAAWDSMAIQHLQGVDHDLPPAPPLYPPQKLTGKRDTDPSGTLES